MNLDQQLKQTVAHFYKNAPAFKDRLDNAGITPNDIQSSTDLAKIPILRKDDLIELQKENPPFGGMLARSMSELQQIFLSPGPINEARPANVQDAGKWAPALIAAGFEAGQLTINCFGYHMTPAGTSLEDALFTIGNAVLPGGIGNQEQQIQAIMSYGITNYVGLPSYLKALIDKAKAAGRTLPLKRALVLAEPLPPSLRQALKDDGVDVFQAYGTAECGNLGYECSAIEGWHIPDKVIVQICDPVTGEPVPHGEQGEVVATLLNDHYAMIRFGVGDLSSINDTPCSCGLTSLRLNGWQGRVGAATKVRGMFLHPTQLGNMMKKFDEVLAYQAVITREDHRDNLELHVVFNEGVDATTVSQKIAQTARETIRFRLNVVSVDSVEGGPIRDERDWE